jgi:TonB family protein
MSVRSFRNHLWQAVILAVFCASSLAHAEEALTWQESNKRSAALIREQGPSEEAARLALQAFTLYETQSASYTALNHAQLLLNAVDARQKATGVKAALRDLERGAERIAKRTDADQSVLLVVWQEAIRLARSGGGTRHRLDDYYRHATRLADKGLGSDNPRAIALHLGWVMDVRADRGYGWARSKLDDARERAGKMGEESALVSRIDLDRAKLEIERERVDEGIARYRKLVEKLERLGQPEQALLLQMAYAQLEYAYELDRNNEAAKEIRERRNRASFPMNELVPMARIPPTYPRSAARMRTEGKVVMKVLVGPDGRVEDATVTHSDPPGVFDEVALKAMRQWKFKPKFVNGQPEPQSGLQAIEFLMEK